MRNLKSNHSRRWPKIALLGSLSVLAVAAGVFIAGWIWYNQQISLVVDESGAAVKVTIEPGSTPDQIAKKLQDEGVIGSQLAFLLYTRFNGVQNSLQAGTFNLSPADTIPQTAKHLVDGKVDSMSVLFYPGATLRNYAGKPDNQRQDIESSLLKAGFTLEEIDAGFKADYSEYNDTLFQGRPANADLEGYIYGDTYSLNSGATVEDALRAAFDEFWRVIEQNDYVAKFSAKGLSLYEGITLGSIIQKEAVGGDEAEIAQVFYSRLEMGMRLGSDPTYQYAADKAGVERSLELDSPYNTRVVQGLTPGPIATAGVAALNAVAEPANTDYLYFLHGDDDKIYFAHTIEQHNNNIAQHCQVKCLSL